jgi:hypothetical protein
MVGKGVASAGWNGVGVGDGIAAEVTSTNGNACKGGGVACPQAGRRNKRARVSEMRRSINKL